ncbi:efflux RND transporter periplasmic adaptor subunit [Longibacter salinarum]|nr:efflux RND transporter periplasmic adaptor subunit [Longibacter salinarum]
MELSRQSLVLSGIAALILFAAGGAFAYETYFRSDEPGVHTAGISERPIESVVKGFGRARPSVEIPIRSEVSGEIMELYVKEGDRVREGDPLVRLRDDDYRAAIQQRRASVLRAQADVAAARADSFRVARTLAREERLFEREMVPQSSVQEAQSAYDQSVARLEATEAAVKQTEALLDRARELAQQTRISTPITGIVTQLNVEVGERVLGTMRVQGTEIMRLGGPEAMEFVVSVPEDQIRTVDVGDAAEIQTESYGERLLKGRVVELANAARMGEGGIGSASEPEYPVHVRVTSPHKLAARLEPVSVTATDSADESGVPVLRPGMSGEVRILAASIADALAVPRAAVTTRNVSRLDSSAVAEFARLRRPPTGEPDDLRRVVFVLTGGVVHMVEVAVGLRSESVAQVSGQLQARDTVIVAPEDAVARELVPGARRSVDTFTEASAY